MSSKTKGIIFYTSNEVKQPVKAMAWSSIVDSDLPITTSYLQPSEKKCYRQMVKQIIYCLDKSTKDYVFFCEDDVIYPKSHFDFLPSKDNIFYYNSNVWRWDYPQTRYITYDRLISLSGMCVNRKFALDHYRRRLEAMPKDDTGGEPMWVRRMGYEPGTKKKKRGGFSDDNFEMWQSTDPLIDVRHTNTFSPRKVELSDFKHQPKGWKVIYTKP